MNARLSLWMIGSCSALLLACGGSSTPSDPEPRDRELRWADPALEPLTNEHPPEAVSEYVRNGLRLQVRGVEPATDDSLSPGVPEMDSANGDSGGFSRTNVHVQGVDEADRLKYDGRYLFVAESPQYSYYHAIDRIATDAEIASDESIPAPPQTQALRIFETDPESISATPVMRYEFDRDASSSLTLSQLYTLESDGATEAVVAMSDSRLYYGGGWGWGAMPELARQSGRTLVEIVDVQSPENPTLSWSVEVEGALLNSRKIGDVLYLVSRTSPTIEGMQPYADSEEVRAENERLISSAPMTELLPGYRLNRGDEQPLVREGDCYLPETLNPEEGYADIVTVSAFNLREQELVSAVCVNAHLSGLYMSLDSLYLGTHGGDWMDQKTGLHKFSVDNGTIDYRGTGLVPGSLNWSDPSFSMDEDQGYLRVVTTLREDWSDFEHFLHVLEESEDPDSRTLEVVARLPNDAQPDPIGKPGEDIFAVRFLGDRAYIVTFQQIDPLYVIDVTDNENPAILGELEIPGVSNYLHPVGEGYLVSVGQAADESGFVQGVKIELFDVRDDLNPISVDDVVLGARGSWSEALTDLRAFNFLATSDDQFRFSLPVSRYADGYSWQDSGLHLFEINQLTGDQAALKPIGPMIVESAAQSNESAAVAPAVDSTATRFITCTGTTSGRVTGTIHNRSVGRSRFDTGEWHCMQRLMISMNIASNGCATAPETLLELRRRVRDLLCGNRAGLPSAALAPERL